MRRPSVRARRLARIRELESSPGLLELMQAAEDREFDLQERLEEIQQGEHGHPTDAGGHPVASIHCPVCTVVDR